LALGSASGAGAQTLSPIEKSMDAVPGSPGSEKYDGVVPGANARNPLPPAPSERAYLVWTGFRMTDSGSQVFLQTTRSVSYETKEEKRGKSGRRTVVVLLRDCRIHMANNRRTIDTRYFATPVAKVSARQRKANVEVRIVLRQGADTTARTEEGTAGSQFLLFDFPPGKATVAPEPGEGTSRLLGPEAVQDSSDSAELTPPGEPTTRSK
jgi:hypothetical protein